jgi:rRNA maturation protein Nop10
MDPPEGSKPFEGTFNVSLCARTRPSFDIPPIQTVSSMQEIKDDTAPLNETPCNQCGRPVDDRAPACPNCGEKVYVEHPGDITPVKHDQLPHNRGVD